MLPSVLMNLDFAATATPDAPPGVSTAGNLLLLHVGRMVLIGYPLTKVIQWLSSLFLNRV